MNPFSFIAQMLTLTFQFFTKLAGVADKSLDVVNTNIESLQSLSNAGNLYAKDLETTALKQLQSSINEL